MRAEASTLCVTIRLNFELSLWQAIKLRIAGRNFKSIAEEILRDMRKDYKCKEEK